MGGKRIGRDIDGSGDMSCLEFVLIPDIDDNVFLLVVFDDALYFPRGVFLGFYLFPIFRTGHDPQALLLPHRKPLGVNSDIRIPQWLDLLGEPLALAAFHAIAIDDEQ